RAKELGFDLVGIAQAGKPTTYAHFERWLEQGFHGTMAYMEQRKAERTDVKLLMPDAKSVIVVAISYFVPDKPNKCPEGIRGLVARYAWGLDYHEVLLRKLKALFDHLKALLGDWVKGKAWVDTGPILERDFAFQAGLGWFGKNTCLINPKIGSYLFLGELIVNIPLTPDEPFSRSYCGKCVRCITACPTGALIAPYQLDARRCISYLTIELRGSIPRELRPLIGTWVFGCDICQDVCPWNRKAKPTNEEAFKPRTWAEPKLLDLLQLSDEEFREKFGHSPIKRIKRSGLVRNACIALGNLKDTRAVPLLINLLFSDSDTVVREHAAWALGQIATEDAVKALGEAILTEKDETVRQEIALSLSEFHRLSLG
ncbi:MAG: tRNA epoxyqueuosine(34) reductase QueG, partial [Armatimonadota bacterium]|nr:tRNA epoxyqueuosine(34) reductase QueG [Armatimonadota bacterium]MDW8143735.1 tRNA epoxyqueuosine(34) reductase QueG [Armatimonadota bacterium]